MTDRDQLLIPVPNLLRPTTDVVCAYLRTNPLPVSELAALVSAAHAAVVQVAYPAPVVIDAPKPAVPVSKSITPDALISLIDGKPYRTLKRHLAGHGLTPETYRERYGLRHDYPMVAAAYAAKRSELAKATGLGQSRRKVAVE